jgi:hypothetical protein
MHLQWLDWIVVAACLLICFAPALLFGRRAGHGVLLCTVVAALGRHGRSRADPCCIPHGG